MAFNDYSFILSKASYYSFDHKDKSAGKEEDIAAGKEEDIAAGKEEDIAAGKEERVVVLCNGKEVASVKAYPEQQKTNQLFRINSYFQLSGLIKDKDKGKGKIHKFVPIMVEYASDNSKTVRRINIYDLFKEVNLGDKKIAKVMLKGLINENDENKCGVQGIASFIIENRIDMLANDERSIESQAESMTAYFKVIFDRSNCLEDTRPILYSNLDTPLSEEVRDSIRLKENLSFNPALAVEPDLLKELSKSSTTLQGRTHATKKATSAMHSADNFITKLIQKNTKIDVKTISRLHVIVAKEQDINGGTPGQFRVAGQNICASGTAFVSGVHVEEEMGKYVAWLQDQLQLCEENKANPIEVAALAALKFISIHPFTDGNGRTARLVMNYVLEKNNIPPSSIQKQIIAVFAIDSDEERKKVEDAVSLVREGVIVTCNILSLEPPFINE